MAVMMYGIILRLHRLEFIYVLLAYACITKQVAVTMIPQTWSELTDEKDIKNMNKILDLLDEDDDVQEVYHNWDE